MQHELVEKYMLAVEGLKIALNSLCGISLNATCAFTHKVAEPEYTDSQFPLWDFFECNTGNITPSSKTISLDFLLSIPFVGFL
jgi:hypothetical protein